VREIVDGHGGFAVIEDAASGDARFRIAIPGARRVISDAQNSTASAQHQSAHG
jgi:hypothetical protein